MITYTKRLDIAIRVAATAHKNQKRKGANIPYIVHPFGVMMLAANVTTDEDTLIACLFHDIVEDVPEEYSADQIRTNFGDRVLNIVLDVTKNDDITDWRKRSEAYLDHLEHDACDEAVIVSAADKIHNLTSMIVDYEDLGDELWNRFTTKSAKDQLWWYQSILEVIKKRNAPKPLIEQLQLLVGQLKTIL